MHIRGLKGLFQWILRPQWVIAVTVICLCMAAAGKAQRTSLASDRLEPTPTVARVQGANSQLLPLPDCSVLPCIALTFDDGPNRQITPQVLDMLGREGLKATFFIIGREVAGKEDLVRRIHAEGHEIGNHTYNHPRLPQLPAEAIEAEIASTQAAIASAGVPLPEVMRPPYGEVSPFVRAHVQMPIIRWDVDTEDWKTRDAVKIYSHLLQYAHPGAVMLLHDTHQSTVDALGPALQLLRAQYQFVTVSQLLGVSGGDQGQYFGRTP